MQKLKNTKRASTPILSRQQNSVKTSTSIIKSQGTRKNTQNSTDCLIQKLLQVFFNYVYIKIEFKKWA